MPTRVIYREDGEPWFAIEVAETAPIASPLRGGPVESALTSLREAGEIIGKTSKDILGAMRETLADVSPDAVELTFGVTLGAEGALPLVVKASGEATFEVKLSWAGAQIEAETKAGNASGTG